MEYPLEPIVQSVVGHHLEDDGKPLLISRYAGFFSRDDRARFDALCHRLHQVNLPHVSLLLAIESQPGDTVYTVTPLPQGARCDTLSLPLGLRDALCIGAQVAQALGQMHALGVLHLDLRPEQVYWDHRTRTATVVRPRIVAVESAQAQGVSMWSRRARYGAPEVTQELKWRAQRASDVYGLGVLVWELCAGTPLFPQASTPHQWTQAHLNWPWVPPKPCPLPARVISVLQRLLQKDPADRDLPLLQVARELEAIAQGSLDELAPRLGPPRRDYLSRMVVGREALCSKLEKRLRNSRRYPVHLTLLHGPLGIGKSCLLNWYEARVRQEEGCILISCSPTLASGVNWERELLAALERVMLAMGRAFRDHWVQQMGQAPSFVTHALMEYSAFFDRLFRQKRFSFSRRSDPIKPPLEFVLLHAYEALGRVSPGTVVVMTLDDMEQLESSQLALFERWVGLLGGRGLVIRAVMTLDEQALGKQAAELGGLVRRFELEQVPVGRLEEDAVILWLYEGLGEQGHLLTEDFLELLTSVTGGVPLIIKQAVGWWQKAFEQGAQPLEQVMGVFRAEFIDKDISRMIAARWLQLDQEMVHTLRVCSAYRRSLSLLTLSTFLACPLEHLCDQVQQAVALGILCWRRPEVSFVHEDVRCVIWAEDPAMMRATTYALAALMLGQFALAKQVEEAHTLQCADLLVVVDASPDHQLRDLGAQAVVGCLLGAARVCLGQDECKESARYGMLALGLGPKPELREEWFALTRLTAEALVRTDELDLAIEWLDRGLLHLDDPRHRHELYSQKLAILALLSQYEMVMALVQDALIDLGEAPLEPGEYFNELSQFSEFESLFGAVESGLSRLASFDQLAHLPPLPHAHPKALAQSFLAHLLPITCTHLPRTFPLVVCRLMELTLQHGVCADSVRGITAYAQLLASECGRYDQAFELGQVATMMAQSQRFAPSRAVVYSDMANYITPWKRRIQDSQVLNEQSHVEALRVGDMLYAGYSLMHDAFNRFSQGMPLPHLNAFLTRARRFCSQTQNQLAQDVLDGLALVLRDDLGVAPEPGAPALLEDHEAFMLRCMGNQNTMARALYAVAKMRTQMMASRSERAMESAELFFRLRPHIHGLFQEREGDFLYAILMHTQRRLEGRLDEAMPPDLAAISRRLDIQATSNPPGMHHWVLWLEAVCTQDTWMALGKYESAYQLVRKQGIWHDAAMIKEQCARVLQQEGRTSLWMSYQEDARAMFTRWGSHEQTLRLSAAMTHSSPPLLHDGVETPAPRSQWSLAKLTQAAMEMASKQELKELLEAAILPLLQVSAASQVVLMCEHQGEFVYMARALAKSEAVTWTHGQDEVLLTGGFSLRVLQAVADLGQEIILPHACQEGPFTHDPRVRELLICSVLCGLVRRGREPRIYFYLEHEDVPNLFAHDRLEQIHLLVAQLSWAIDKLG